MDCQQPVVGASHHRDRALFAMLRALSGDQLLSRDYVVKGGLALNLVFGSPRQSEDLDLSSARPFTDEVNEEKNEMLLALCELLDAELKRTAAASGIEAAHVHEKRLSVEIPALLGSVRYREAGMDGAGEHWHEVKMQVTLSELVCETVRREVHGMVVHSAALEDILAEKLKAILQQVTSDKVRSMDVFDIWYFTTARRHELDEDRLRQYLEIKTAQWPEVYPPTADRYRDPKVRAHSERNFEGVIELVREPEFRVPFDEAFAGVLTFVEDLDLPQ